MVADSEVETRRARGEGAVMDGDECAKKRGIRLICVAEDQLEAQKPAWYRVQSLGAERYRLRHDAN